MPNTLTENLQTGLLRNQHHLVQFEKSIDAKIQANLLELQRELRLEIEGADFGSRTLTQQNRLQGLQRDVNGMINGTYRQNTADLHKGLTGIAEQAERLTVGHHPDADRAPIAGPESRGAGRQGHRELVEAKDQS